jgi:SOS-response transcriptional repressor LexA
MFSMSFSTLLKELIPAERGAMTDLAHKLGVTPNYIFNITRPDGKVPSLPRCQEIADALHLQPEVKNRLLFTAAEERIDPEELAVLKEAFKRPQAPYPNNWAPPDPAMKVPLIKREKANKRITEDDLPAVPAAGGLITVSKPAHESTYALKLITDAMVPKMSPNDVIVIEDCHKPKDGDFVIVADKNGKIPLLRQFKNYGNTGVLRAFNPQYPEIVLEGAAAKQYEVVGKVIERIPCVELYA